MRYFAVGMKGWVEVRKAKAPPKAVVTEVNTGTVKRDERWDWRTGEAVITERPIKIRQVAVIGGSVLATVKARTFNTRAGISIKPGVVLELTKDTLETLKLEANSNAVV